MKLVVVIARPEDGDIDGVGVEDGDGDRVEDRRWRVSKKENKQFVEFSILYYAEIYDFF